MSWRNRLLDDGDLRPFMESDQGDFGALAAALVAHQKQHWPVLRAGYERLKLAETRRIAVAETNVVIQHNPARFVSTAASVDAAAVEARGCFLCPDRLPEEEKGLPYADELVVLCNPFPILENHLTIVARDHGAQAVEGSVEWLLRLAHDLGPDWFVLYNGPQCGASAPDHLHFQACSRNGLPIFDDLKANEAPSESGCDICEHTRDNLELFTIEGCGRSTVVFRSNTADYISQLAYAALMLLPSSSGEEPLVNLIGTWGAGQWTLLMFPRARHRPEAYYAEGDDRMLVSPGSIDMAGVVVTPRRRDFERLDSRTMEGIYDEVSLDDGLVNEVLEQVSASVSGSIW